MEQAAHRGWLGFYRRTPLYVRILVAMALGVGIGLALGPGAGSLAIPSRLVLRLLGALAPPLILVAIIKALVEAHFEAGTARRLITLLVLNTVVAICIGLAVANVLKPGLWSKQLHPAAKDGMEHAAGKVDPLQQFLDNIPQSILGPLTDNGKVIGVIVLALAFGIALKRSAHKPVHTPKEWIDLALETLVTILHWVIEIVPLAVFGLVASIVGTQGFAPFRALGAFIVAVLVALLLQATYYLLRVRISSWVSPVTLVRECRDALFMAFSTGSSTVTMPVTFQCLRDGVGLRERSASLGALVGANFNNDGTALYEAMAALFVSQLLAAQGSGAELTLVQQVLVVVTSVIASVGAAGIPEAGLVTMTMVFHAVNLPTEYIALLLPVDWFLDRCRTVINVMGDMNVSCMVDGKTPEAAAADGGVRS
jgi:DAACS family dicarboxylate/amino acid:cation (Na+ or H+) symporter